jgi:hypothetical protein
VKAVTIILSPPVARKKVYQGQAAGSYRPRAQAASQKFIAVVVTVAVNREANGEAGVESYSKTGGECGIRTRGGGFAARSL